MNSRYLLSCLCVVALCLLAGPAARAADDTSSLEGKPAPDVSLKTLDDKDFKLSELKGNVVVLDFWATWCPPCRRSLPHLNKVANNKKLAEKDVKVFAVDCRETKDKVQDYLKKNDLHFNVPMDDGAAMKDYLVQGIPTTIVIGRDGVIQKVMIGFGGDATEKALDEAVEKAAKEPKPQK